MDSQFLQRKNHIDQEIHVISIPDASIMALPTEKHPSSEEITLLTDHYRVLLTIFDLI